MRRSQSDRPLVLLYNPRAAYHTMPLGLVAIGSALDRERFDVRIIDGRLVPDGVEALRPHLERALCLGVSVLTGAPIADALVVSRAVKALRPDLPIIWGGWHPSLFPTDCLAEAGVDVTVQAQGESTMREIAQRLADGAAPHELAGVQGCAHRVDASAGSTIVLNPPRPLIAAEALPAHDYALIDVESYFAKKRLRQVDYITSYGCHFRCDFCADPFVYARQWTGLSPARIVAELTALHRTHPFDDVSFQDETFFTHVERVTTMAEGLLSAGHAFSWAGTLRADQAARLSDADLALCRRSGLRRVLIGVEAGSQAMLDWMHKDIRLEQVLDAAERCRDLGIAVQFPFIVGFPGESDASVRASLSFAARLRLMSPAFETPVFYFKPYPGSSITREAVRSGFQLPESLADWAAFDIQRGAGPWVSARIYRRVERFKRLSGLAWRPRGGWRRPFAALARSSLRRWARAGAAAGAGVVAPLSTAPSTPLPARVDDAPPAR
ncbi:MAG: radical SAM protein [Ardenticatenales bacterium]